ncbi:MULTISPECIES: histone-like nucleoid-structuring protein Lsr2 [Streptosporangium]|uniref:Lsr2 family protein n=1 Tax=Streptosporangium brasiliense TaxID=47480 RepID=A0ABT9RLZ2_9ACTN|nr:Lsr2 family protein [Streptosporangium brasiliense]MDP9870311.1 hypothetical protein [Streptosporangium brasiliense]
MAKQIIEKVTDDIDGTEGARNVTFAIDGDQYEIDLSDKNSDELRKALARFINAARPVRQERAQSRRQSGNSSNGGGKPNRDASTAIRTWAKEQGLTVSERGRISASILEKYKNAH